MHRPNTQRPLTGNMQFPVEAGDNNTETVMARARDRRGHELDHVYARSLEQALGTAACAWRAQ